MDSVQAARPEEEEEEEARRRRSTDCIYFLASPLTCKKGSECDYRHSDAARMNPRDCWYWFNGNCTNPKCSFRHPPLDSLLGAPTTPRAAQQPASQVPVPTQARGSSAANNSSSGTGPAKHGVPCYYFQKGMCAKGDKCAFLHVPQAAGNPAPQPTAKVFNSLQPNPQLKNSWTKPNSPAQQNTPPSTSISDKSSASTHHGKPAQKQNLTSRLDHSSRTYPNPNSSYIQSGTAKNYQPQPSVEDGLAENGVEVGEFVRGPSAGAGVLVGGVNDDARRSFNGNHSSYHHTNRGLHPEMVRQRHERERERSNRSSSESLLSEKRNSQRDSVPVTAGTSDLRHRLLKQRRLNNPRSTQVTDNRQDAYVDNERHDHQQRRGEEQASNDSLSRSRLRGRIKLPGDTSFDRLGTRLEKESDRRPEGRLSPPKHTDLRGKLHERLKVRSNEDTRGNAKGLMAKASSGEDAGSLNFAGPKSLAELKAKKVVGSSGDVATNSSGSLAGPTHMTSEIVGSRDDPEPVPFEGPKPLSAILKRKREAASENAAHSRIQEEEKEEEEEEEGALGVEEEYQNNFQILESDMVEANMEGNGEEETFHTEDHVVYDDNPCSPADDNATDGGKELEEQPQDVEAAEEEYEVNAEDDSTTYGGKETEEPQDVEAGEEEYEVNAEDDSNYQEYEDDDDDDFARKVGVMIS